MRRMNEKDMERLMQEHGTALMRMACLYLRDAALAQDAVQETFLKAYARAAQFRGDAEEKTWLTRIAINTCKDMRRTAWMRMVDRRVDMEYLQGEAEFPLPDDTVVRAVMDLPKKDKAVILLRYYQNMKLSQISAVLGVPEPTVSSRLKRARHKLEKTLKGWYFDED